MRVSGAIAVVFSVGAAALACGAVSEGAAPAEAPDASAPDATTLPLPAPRGDAASPAPDAAPKDAAPDGPLSATSCFLDLAGPVKGPDYDQFHPILETCAGTHHQTIAGVERVVFLGDSVTEGTPPTLPAQFYRSLLGAELTKKFGAIEIADCAVWGARMNDLLEGKAEIAKCFPNGGDPRHTLVVMTNGGNDIAAWTKSKMTTAQAIAEADTTADQLRDAVRWLKDPARFPKGTDVVFSNVYEYSDTSGDLSSCPTAALLGFSGTWTEGTAAVVHLQERLMQVAVETRSDMVFLLETFCGHGFKKDDATLQCYRGPNTDLWFDLTCIHPNPTGHAQVAKLFATVIGLSP